MMSLSMHVSRTHSQDYIIGFLAPYPKIMYEVESMVINSSITFKLKAK